jgi:hypothetical protein
MIIEVTYMIFWVIFAYFRGYTIVYRFHILKRVNQVLQFSHTQEGYQILWFSNT